MNDLVKKEKTLSELNKSRLCLAGAIISEDFKLARVETNNIIREIGKSSDCKTEYSGHLRSRVISTKNKDLSICQFEVNFSNHLERLFDIKYCGREFKMHFDVLRAKYAKGDYKNKAHRLNKYKVVELGDTAFWKYLKVALDNKHIPYALREGHNGGASLITLQYHEVDNTKNAFEEYLSLNVRDEEGRL